MAEIEGQFVSEMIGDVPVIHLVLQRTEVVQTLLSQLVARYVVHVLSEPGRVVLGVLWWQNSSWIVF